MQPTAKWNEELPLAARKKTPAVRRYSIAVDKRPPMNVVIRDVVDKPPEKGFKIKRHFEIQGNNRRRPSHNASEDLFADSVRARYESRFGTPVASFPSGIVARRATVKRSRQPNQLATFPSGRITPRRRPFGQKMTLQALAVTNPAAYQMLAAHPEAHKNGVVLGFDGNVYVTTTVGWGMPSGLKKVGRVVKKGAQATGRGIQRGAKAVSSAAQTVARTTAKLAKLSAKALAAAAKTVARLAATPVIMAARPAFQTRLRVVAKGRAVTPQMRAGVKKEIIGKMLASKNPLIKFSGLVLSYVGITKIGGGMSVMGMTGAEIAALAQSAAIALKPYLIKLATTWVVAKGTQMLREKIAPPQRGPVPGQMPQQNPSYTDYGTAQDAGNYQSYGTAADYEQPNSYAEATDPAEYNEAESSGAGTSMMGFSFLSFHPVR
jgi:hypothetical protein